MSSLVSPIDWEGSFSLDALSSDNRTFRMLLKVSLCSSYLIVSLVWLAVVLSAVVGVDKPVLLMSTSSTIAVVVTIDGTCFGLSY